MATITITIEQELADRFNEADEQERLRLQSLIRSTLIESTSKTNSRRRSNLDDVLERAHKEALANGLTPELLEQLLSDE